MSASHPRLGVNHLTVVPTNFERPDDAEELPDEESTAASASDGD